MDQSLATRKYKKDYISVTSSITHVVTNTHCIICGEAFSKGRVGKFYCSPRCKQFSYNHKDKISEILESKNREITNIQLSFPVEDFTDYQITQRKLKRYNQLDKKSTRWEAIDQELTIKNKIGLELSNFALSTYAAEKLTPTEEAEYNALEREFDVKTINLNLVELSIEQWSFIKSLYPELDWPGLYQIISSLSKEFYGQLSLDNDQQDGKKEMLLIKNKFINHCNLIAEGVVTFYIRDSMALKEKAI